MSSTKSFDQISSEYSISLEYLSIINRVARKNPQFTYPIRKSGNECLTKDTVAAIEGSLINTSDSIECIARKFHIDSNTIYKVNNGLHKWNDKDIDYPIRKPMSKLSSVLIEMIIKDLSSANLKMQEIEIKYNLSKPFLSRFNNGKIYRQEGIIYPIRPSSKRVY